MVVTPAASTRAGMARDPPGWYGKLAMLGDFAQRRLPEHAVRRCDTWLSQHDPSFSAKLGAAGFLGLPWSKEYGGHGRTALDRFVVVEELLAAGAPIAAHWVSDRQSKFWLPT